MVELCLLCFFSSSISNRLADFVLPDWQGGWGRAGRQKYFVFSWGERLSERLPPPGPAPPRQSPLTAKSSTETTEEPVLWSWDWERLVVSSGTAEAQGHRGFGKALAGLDFALSWGDTGLSGGMGFGVQPI